MSKRKKLWLAGAALGALALLGILSFFIHPRSHTPAFGEDCSHIGATAKFADGSPAVCTDLYIPGLYEVHGGAWMFPKDYRQ